MDVKEIWLLSLSAKQARQQAAMQNGEFRKKVHAMRAAQYVRACKLRLAALTAALAWMLVSLQCFDP